MTFPPPLHSFLLLCSKATPQGTFLLAALNKTQNKSELVYLPLLFYLSKASFVRCKT